MSIAVALVVLVAVVGIFALVARGVVRRDMSGPADDPGTHGEVNPHDVPRWDRATRGAAEEQQR